jgi:hypothetical protein
MQTPEYCIEQADQLAAEVANEWVTHFVPYNAADIPIDFTAVLDASDQYQASKKTSNEMASREAFAKAYIGYRSKQETAKSD